jgi:hypothetical protein
MVFAKSLIAAVASCALLATSTNAAAIKRNDDRLLVTYQSNPNFCDVWKIAWCVSWCLPLTHICLLEKIVFVIARSTLLVSSRTIVIANPVGTCFFVLCETRSRLTQPDADLVQSDSQATTRAKTPTPKRWCTALSPSTTKRPTTLSR